ncbi:MAG: GTPase HflX [Thermoleophilia bacterium]|nr:GTPase HflX [Thermoleophilia bacterium]
MGKDRFLDHGKDRELQRTYRGRAAGDDRPDEGPREGPETAVVVGSYPRAAEAAASLAEMVELLRTARVDVVETMVQQRDAPDPRTFLGKGKLDELRGRVEALRPDVVAVDHELSPGQQRQLEDRLKTRVVDRTAVILDIFALHATTAEGKLQVELAQLEYSYSRQEGLWQHLERLGGGVGTRGPGESQLESDRRLVRNRMGVLRRRLRDVARSRGVMRQGRGESGVPRVALAGYTNAGKSSLMNALSGAGVSVNDALFETLDATTRAIEFQGFRLLLSDTVGFISGLPHQLVDAFRSTLDEAREADLILHVADASEPETRRLEQASTVDDVLEEIGAGEVPRLFVLNKIDAVDADTRRELAGRHPDALRVSAITGEGLDALRERLADVARAAMTHIDVIVPWQDGATLSAIYSQGRDVRHTETREGVRVTALMPAPAAARLRAGVRGAGA